MTVVSASRPTYVAKEMRTEVLETGLCVPITSSTSCDRAIFVDVCHERGEELHVGRVP
jgi:hypothetical protein